MATFPLPHMAQHLTMYVPIYVSRCPVQMSFVRCAINTDCFLVIWISRSLYFVTNFSSYACSQHLWSAIILSRSANTSKCRFEAVELRRALRHLISSGDWHFAWYREKQTNRNRRSENARRKDKYWRGPQNSRPYQSATPEENPAPIHP
jgi:hypothetical protein